MFAYKLSLHIIKSNAGYSYLYIPGTFVASYILLLAFYIDTSSNQAIVPTPKLILGFAHIAQS